MLNRCTSSHTGRWQPIRGHHKLCSSWSTAIHQLASRQAVLRHHQVRTAGITTAVVTGRWSTGQKQMQLRGGSKG